MKARIKQTGEVLIVKEISQDKVFMKIHGTNSFLCMKTEEVDLISDEVNHEPNWEQRRYEIAKDIYISILSKEKEESSHGLEALAVKKAEDLIIALQQPRDLDKFGRIIEQAPYLYKLLEEIATVPKLCTSREFHTFYNEVTTRVREALERCNLNYPEIR